MAGLNDGSKDKIYILIAEDSITQAQQLQHKLEQYGYLTRIASNGVDTLKLINERKPDIIISDIVMPEMDGYELCKKLKGSEKFKDIPIILLTSLIKPVDILKGLESGADNFMIKPFDMPDLISGIQRLTSNINPQKESDDKGFEIVFGAQKHFIHADKLQMLNLLLSTYDFVAHKNDELVKAENDLRELNINLEKMVEERMHFLSKEIVERKRVEKELRESYKKLQKTTENTIEIIARIAEKRDPYTAGHQRRVSNLAVEIAKAVGLKSGQIEGIRMAGIIHDIGKISIPAEILCKPSRLSDIEMQLVMNHTREGHEIVKSIEFPWPVDIIILQHHERIDGSGYPNKLKGDQIIVEAQIIGLSDVVEAMASHRPYRASLGIERALQEIREQSGVSFRHDIVELCLNIFEKGEGKAMEDFS